MAAMSAQASTLHGLFPQKAEWPNRICAASVLQSALKSKPCRQEKLRFVSSGAFGHEARFVAGLRSSQFQKGFPSKSVGVVRCEAANDKSNSLDIWFGRAAMIGFVGVVGVEVATGKGVLENVGLVTPLPTVALALTAVVGFITAFGVFRSLNDV